MTDPIALQAGHIGTVGAVAISPGGTLVATASDDWNVKLWEAATGRVVRTLKQHLSAVVCVAFSPVDRLLASADLTGRIIIWNLDTGSVQSELADPELRAAASLSFRSDGRTLILGTLGGGDVSATIRLWDVDKQRLVLSIDEGSEGVAAAFSSSDMARIWSAGQDGKIKAWNAQTGAQESAWVAHSPRITSLALSPDGQVLASVGGDGAARLWRADSGERLLEITDAAGATGVDFLSGGDAIVLDGLQLRIYDARDGVLRQMLDGHAESVQGVRCLRPGDLVSGIARLATDSSLFGDVLLWDAASGRRLRHFIGQEGLGLTAVAHCRAQSLLISGTAAGRLALWNLRTGGKLQHLQLPWAISSLSAGPGGRLVAVGGGDLHSGSMLVFGTRARQVVRRIEGLPRLVRAAAFSKDGRRLASASEDGVLRIWRVETWQQERAIHSGLGLLFSVVFSNDGSRVFVGGPDGSIKAFDADTGELRATLRNQTSRVFALAMSDDGRLLASGGVQTAAITIWDVQTGAIVREVADGRLSPRSLTFVGNDTLVATNDNGRVLRLGLGDGSIFQLPDIHDMSAMASVVLDGTRFCTAGSEHAIHFFDIQAGVRRATLVDVNAGMAEPRQSLDDDDYLAMDAQGFYAASTAAERVVRILHGGRLGPVIAVRRTRKRPRRVARSLAPR